MTTKSNLTRAQAIALVGEDAVNTVGRENCEYTNRCLDDFVEFAASVEAEDIEGYSCTLTAYYYPSQQEIDDAGDDLSNVEWIVDGYSVG